MPVLSYRRRRLLLSTWRRQTRWEFWSPWRIYPPVVCSMLWLAVKHRGATLFSITNPGMPASGLIGESKAHILDELAGAGDAIAAHILLPSSLPIDERLSQLDTFMADRGLDFPIILKPDSGQRGMGVAVAKDRVAAREYLAAARIATVVQEYVPGVEFGVFYYRLPGEARGAIFSITDKRFPEVTGDGESTLETLILRDDRTVCAARQYFRENAASLHTIPAAGEKVRLIQFGSHARGSLFLDGSRYHSPALLDEMERISRAYDGFYFGRYDVRVPSPEALAAGKGIRVIELNGLTSEATHIYDPQNNWFSGVGTLMKQWAIAWEIGARNRAQGIKPMSPVAIFRFVREQLKRQQDAHSD